MKARRILLIGATGVFGERLARMLARLDGIDLIVTSRTKAKAEAFATQLSAEFPAARISPEALDTGRDIETQFQVLEPWLVIDTSGPFQGASYATAKAALKSGAHWIDIADARDYLLGFGPALDGLAKSEALSAFAGASTSPALSGAVVAHLTRGWRRLDTVGIAVRPGGATRMGRAVIGAVLNYAGLPVATWNEGEPQTVTGWGRPVRRPMPGLGTCYLSAVETADAHLIQQRFGVTSRVLFRFGLQSRLEHFGLILLGALRRRRWIKEPQRLAPLLEKAHHAMARFGSGTGGMTVDVAGLDAEGRTARARWWLVAKQGHGPNVPVLAALALTRKLLNGQTETGARTADRSLTLSNIETEMQPFDIRSERSLETGPGDGLFERALGTPRYAALAPAVRAFHATHAPPIWRGRADVQSGTGGLARVIARLFGFPATARDVAITVSVDRDALAETWTRNFSGRRFSSRLSLSNTGGLDERFGPFRIGLLLDEDNGALGMPVAGWRFGSLPLPRHLAPKSETREYEDSEGRFQFDVRISAPLAGLIAHYQGWLLPDPQQSGQNPPQIAAFAVKRPDFEGEVAIDSAPVHPGAGKRLTVHLGT